MEQLILHLFGDYITQSEWMAQNKTKRAWPAIVHGTIYALPFLWLCRYAPHPIWALLTIWNTHVLVDRFRLARYVVFAKNFLGTPWPKWEDCTATGYPSERPTWLAVWLLIIADNTIHLCLNYIALRWL